MDNKILDEAIDEVTELHEKAQEKASFYYSLSYEGHFGQYDIAYYQHLKISPYQAEALYKEWDREARAYENVLKILVHKKYGKYLGKGD